MKEMVCGGRIQLKHLVFGHEAFPAAALIGNRAPKQYLRVAVAEVISQQTGYLRFYRLRKRQFGMPPAMESNGIKAREPSLRSHYNNQNRVVFLQIMEQL